MFNRSFQRKFQRAGSIDANRLLHYRRTGRKLSRPTTRAKTYSIMDHHPISLNFGPCFVRFDVDLLVVGNALVERSWHVGGDGLLRSVSLRHVATGVQWTAGEGAQTITPGTPTAPGAPGALKVEAHVDNLHPVERPSLVATVSNGAVVQTIRIFQDSAGIVTCLDVVAPRSALDRPADRDESSGNEAGGIEIDAAAAPHDAAVLFDVVDSLKLKTLHHVLSVVHLVDQTDVHNNLVYEQSYRLHPSERKIELRGNLFDIENTLTGDGLIFLKLSPGPDARPIKVEFDLSLRGNDLLVHGHGASADDGTGYPHAVIPYSNGRAGRVAALQRFQRQLRPYVPGRDGQFLSNTWGDRSRDARVNTAFIEGEIAAAERLGVDVLQIDDGWQKGRTANSANSKGGAWTGFWAADAQFWDAHPERLPGGIVALVQRAREKRIRVGLWFAPDSSNDMANWRRDADEVLKFHREWGIDYVKLDAVKMHGKLNERNLHRFYDAVLRESDGRVVFDHDVTAEVRPGYLGATQAGNIFVENRYTDWGNYWPHATLRNLWQLAHHVDPVRLRMEFLNTSRNIEKYGNDPLAPASYDPAYLFACVMFASPLGWFEIQNLPDSFVDGVAPLVRVWKAHRNALFGGRIVPVGNAPDGTQWTGFVSVDETGRHAYFLALRELNDQPEFTFALPFVDPAVDQTQVLAGAGTVAIKSGLATVRIDSPKKFIFATLSVDPAGLT